MEAVNIFYNLLFDTTQHITPHYNTPEHTPHHTTALWINPRAHVRRVN